jgi:hypothetical protein
MNGLDDSKKHRHSLRLVVELSSLLCAGFLFSDEKKKNLLLLFTLISTASIGCQLLSAAANYHSLHPLGLAQRNRYPTKSCLFSSKLWQHFSRRALIMVFHFPLAFPAEKTCSLCGQFGPTGEHCRSHFDGDDLPLPFSQWQSRSCIPGSFLLRSFVLKSMG